MYLFNESSIYSKYVNIETNYRETGFVTKYDKNDNILNNDYQYFLFKKIKE
jgi:hypothetical protein